MFLASFKNYLQPSIAKTACFCHEMAYEGAKSDRQHKLFQRLLIPLYSVEMPEIDFQADYEEYMV